MLGQLVRGGGARAVVLEQAIGKCRLDAAVSEALISRWTGNPYLIRK
jgi:hypothetical protein